MSGDEGTDTDKNTPKYDHTIIMVVLAFEVRGDKIDTFVDMHSVETLASIGAWPVVFHFKDNRRYCKIKICNDPERAFGATFPTRFTDEEWKTKPKTASGFFEDHPELLKALKKNGHVVVGGDETTYQDMMYDHASKFCAWLENLPTRYAAKSYNVSVMAATDTTSADWSRVNALITQAARLGFPYDEYGRWNKRRQFNYGQAKFIAQMILDPTEAEALMEMAPFKRNHRAIDNARAQAYEVAVILFWICVQGKFEAEQYKNNLHAGVFEVYGMDALHLNEMFGQLGNHPFFP